MPLPTSLGHQGQGDGHRIDATLAAPLHLILAAGPAKVILKGPRGFDGSQVGGGASAKIRFAEQTADELVLPKAMARGPGGKKAMPKHL
jgi:hypothetical protein